MCGFDDPVQPVAIKTQTISQTSDINLGEKKSDFILIFLVQMKVPFIAQRRKTQTRLKFSSSRGAESISTSIKTAQSEHTATAHVVQK